MLEESWKGGREPVEANMHGPTSEPSSDGRISSQCIDAKYLQSLLSVESVPRQAGIPVHGCGNVFESLELINQLP